MFIIIYYTIVKITAHLNSDLKIYLRTPIVFIATVFAISTIFGSTVSKILTKI